MSCRQCLSSMSAAIDDCSHMPSLQHSNCCNRSESCSDFQQITCKARSSSLVISARLVSKLICTRKISRFLAMKSCIFSCSFGRRLLGGAAGCAAMNLHCKQRLALRQQNWLDCIVQTLADRPCCTEQCSASMTATSAWRCKAELRIA